MNTESLSFAIDSLRFVKFLSTFAFVVGLALTQVGGVKRSVTISLFLGGGLGTLLVGFLLIGLRELEVLRFWVVLSLIGWLGLFHFGAMGLFRGPSKTSRFAVSFLLVSILWLMVFKP